MQQKNKFDFYVDKIQTRLYNQSHHNTNWSSKMEFKFNLTEQMIDNFSQEFNLDHEEVVDIFTQLFEVMNSKDGLNSICEQINLFDF